MTRVPYQYVVLRCVPRAEREEFVNVGIVLRSQAAEHLEAAFAVDAARVRACLLYTSDAADDCSIV